MKCAKNANSISCKLLLIFYYIAIFFGVIHCHLNRSKLEVQQRKRRNKICAGIIRFVVISFYLAVVPNMFLKFVDTPQRSYIHIFASLQTQSVSFFAVFSLILQMNGEERILRVINKFFKLYQRIELFTQTQKLFGRKFLILFLFKLLTTLIGLASEVPVLMQLNSFFELASYTFGAYIWIGSMFALDGCFLGFLVIALFFEKLGEHLKQMLTRLEDLTDANFDGNPKLSHYSQMKLLCEHADRLDAFAIIYSEVYKITKEFIIIYQWQILFYIYYNFMVVLLLLHQCISVYIEFSEIYVLDICQVVFKIVNLALLVMCAGYATKASDMPNLLPLDLVCSDIDMRWDMSVESFLSLLKSFNIQIYVLGFFPLHHEFILVILSAITSYLFILIQFGITGGFNENEALAKSLQNNKKI